VWGGRPRPRFQSEHGSTTPCVLKLFDVSREGTTLSRAVQIPAPASARLKAVPFPVLPLRRAPSSKWPFKPSVQDPAVLTISIQCVLGNKSAAALL
jgi:hypothetical protein